MVKLTPTEKIRKSIIMLGETQPFFAHLSMALELHGIATEEEWLKQLGVPHMTAAVSSRGELFFYEPWIESLTQEEITGVMCHEVLHPAFDHLLRLGGRQPEIANIAQDMVINMIIAQNRMKMPEKVIEVNTQRDECYVYFGENPRIKFTIGNVSKRWWEDIYDELYQKLDQKGFIETVVLQQGGIEDGRGDRDNHITGTGKGTKKGEMQEAQEIQAQWTQRIAEAHTAAKQRGIQPLGMERFIDKLLQPRINWRSKLRTYMRPYVSPTEFSYRRLHKRTMTTGVVFPNVEKEHMEIEVVIDSSGSIGGAELTRFISECAGIATASQHMKMWITFCDAQVYEDARYEVTGRNKKKLMAMTPKGGGGTRLLAALEFIKKKNKNVPLVLVFTDGYDDYEGTKGKDFPFQVLWCLTKNGVSEQQHRENCGYGAVVKLDE